MKKEINTLFSLFGCAVFGKELDDATKKEASEKAGLIYDMARHHDLAHLLDYAYKTSGITPESEEIAFKLLKQQAVAVLRYENSSFALAKLSELFESEKIAFIPLKGAVIRNLYPQGWMRTSCDIDVLVHEKDIDRVQKLLVERLGYTSDGKRHYHDISLYSDNDVHLELHFSIKENMENIDGLLERVWDYALPKNEGSFEYVLTKEFLLFQHLAHMSYHVAGGGIGIKAFMDYVILEEKVEFDREKLEEMLKECEIFVFYECVKKLSSVWFGEEQHDETTLLFQKFLLNGGVYGTKKNQIAANHGKKSTFGYIWNRVFMPYEKLCITYPNLKGKRYLVPFYQVRRWCRTLVNGRLVSAPEEIKANNSVLNDNTEAFSKLFEAMKLNRNS